jgi:hypothetical protein
MPVIRPTSLRGYQRGWMRADALDALRDELAERGVVLAPARVKQELRRDLEAAGFLHRLGPGAGLPHPAHRRTGVSGLVHRIPTTEGEQRMKLSVKRLRPAWTIGWFDAAALSVSGRLA